MNLRKRIKEEGLSGSRVRSRGEEVSLNVSGEEPIRKKSALEGQFFDDSNVLMEDQDDMNQDLIDIENEALVEDDVDIASTSSVGDPSQNMKNDDNTSSSAEERIKPYRPNRYPRRSSRQQKMRTSKDEITNYYNPVRSCDIKIDIDDPNFSFTEHYDLLPYRVYYDIIMRAHRDPAIISLEFPKLRPSSGSIVIYDCKGTDHYRQIHNDGYRWGRSKGVKLLQSVDNKLVRTYHFLFSPQNPAGDPSYKKYRFNLKDDPYGILVFHYIGDEKRALAVSEKCMDKSNALAILERGVQEVEAAPDLSLLRVVHPGVDGSLNDHLEFNRAIMQNLQHIRQKLLYEDGESFVEGIYVTRENKIDKIVLYAHPLIEQLIGVASYLQQGVPFRTVLLFYHTEPCSSEFQLSTLSFLHPLFEGEQIIPLAFMISSSLNSAKKVDHDFFLNSIHEKFRDLENGRLVIVTGQNLHFSPESFPVAEHLRCWIDFKRIKMNYLETNSVLGADAETYANDMNLLMSCQTEKIFDEVWERISSTKRYTDHPDVLNYFTNVWTDFKFSSAVWQLKMAGVPEAEKGIIWRGSEHLKKVLGQLCENNAHADITVISLFLITNAFRRFFIAGMHQCGAWRLKKCYRERFQQSHLRLPKLPYAPSVESIVLIAFNYCPGRDFKNARSAQRVQTEYELRLQSKSDLVNKPIIPHQISIMGESKKIDSTPTVVYRSSADLLGKFECKFLQSVRLVGQMTFIVRGKSGAPQVVEARQAEGEDSLQWYCSCGNRQICQHVKKALQKINE